MRNRNRPTPQFKVGDVCVFTNHGSSGYRGNDGKQCRITRIKHRDEWVDSNVPAYVIQFIGEDHGFGVSENELKPAKRKEVAR